MKDCGGYILKQGLYSYTTFYKKWYGWEGISHHNGEGHWGHGGYIWGDGEPTMGL